VRLPIYHGRKGFARLILRERGKARGFWERQEEEEEVLDRAAVEVFPVQGKAVFRNPNRHHHPRTHSHHHHLRTHYPRHQEIKEVLAVQEVILPRHPHLQEVVVHLRHLVHHLDARDVRPARAAQTHQTPVRLPREEILPTRKERYVD
jgi:hypothetical protein